MSSTAQSPSALDAPVVIAGAGPVGLVLALELSHHGVRSILVERRAATTTFPKMDVTNARSMELLARLGVADLVRSVGVDSRHSFDVVFCSSLAGREFGRWRQPSVDALNAEIVHRVDGSAPAEAWRRTSQAHVEAALMQRCLTDPLIDVRRPWSVVEVTQDADGVQTTIAHGETGDELVMRSAYVVGCDGAHSLFYGMDERAEPAGDGDRPVKLEHVSLNVRDVGGIERVLETWGLVFRIAWARC